MTRAEVFVEYYGLALRSLMADAQELWQTAYPLTDRESVTSTRIALCQARKAEQLARARQAGLI